MSTETEWFLRNACERDIPFIYSTWASSYRYGSPLGKSCRNKIFFPYFNRVIDWILMRDQCKIRVACSKEDANIIFGYIVFEPNIIHYAFTSELLRRFGIFNSLLREIKDPMYFTLKTFSITEIIKKYPDLIFNPFLLYQQGDSQ